MIMPIAYSAAALAKKRNYPTIDFAHGRASRLFRSRLIKQDQFLALVEMTVPELPAAKRRELANLVQLWQSLLLRKAKKTGAIEVNLQNRSANLVFWEVVEGFRAVDGEHLSVGFRILLKSLTMLNELFKNDRPGRDYVQVAILLSQSPMILGTYFLIAQSAMANRVFREACSRQEMTVWGQFETSIKKLFVDDKKLMTKFFELQQLITFGPSQPDNNRG
jgi:hypothetical protein